jgi:hypothetical protein
MYEIINTCQNGIKVAVRLEQHLPHSSDVHHRCSCMTLDNSEVTYAAFIVQAASGCAKRHMMLQPDSYHCSKA